VTYDNKGNGLGLLQSAVPMTAPTGLREQAVMDCSSTRPMTPMRTRAASPSRTCTYGGVRRRSQHEVMGNLVQGHIARKRRHRQSCSDALSPALALRVDNPSIDGIGNAYDEIDDTGVAPLGATIDIDSPHRENVTTVVPDCPSNDPEVTTSTGRYGAVVDT